MFCHWILNFFSVATRRSQAEWHGGCSFNFALNLARASEKMQGPPPPAASLPPLAVLRVSQGHPFEEVDANEKDYLRAQLERTHVQPLYLTLTEQHLCTQHTPSTLQELPHLVLTDLQGEHYYHLPHHPPCTDRKLRLGEFKHADKEGPFDFK